MKTNTTLDNDNRVSVVPDFLKLFVDDLALLEKLPKSVSSVLLALLKEVRYNDDGVFFINSFVKKQILTNCKSLHSTQTVSNSISVLKKKGILIDKGREAYIFNPELFGCADFYNIQNLQLHIFYDSNGRTLTTELSSPFTLSSQSKPQIEVKEKIPECYLCHSRLDDSNLITLSDNNVYYECPKCRAIMQPHIALNGVPNREHEKLF